MIVASHNGNPTVERTPLDPNMTVTQNRPSPVKSVQQSSTPTRRIVTFRLAGQVYGLPLEAVQETVFLPLLSQPPGLPAVVAGFFSLGGSAVAVLRLDHLFGIAIQSRHRHTPLLVLRHFVPRLALMVEEVIGIVALQSSAVMPVPENSSFNECSEGVAMAELGNIILLSPDRILLESEQQRIAALTALEEARLAELTGGEI